METEEGREFYYYRNYGTFSDVVPICVQVVNVVLVGPGGTWDTMLFFATTYLLYAVEVVITGVAVWVIYARARELSSVQTNAVREAAFQSNGYAFSIALQESAN